MVEIAEITTGLESRESGFWVAPEQSEVSHPEQYQDWYLAVESNSYWFRHRAECIVQAMRQFPPQGPVVDVGGGSGHVSLAIGQAGFEPVLVEPSPGAARSARSRGLAPVICSTLQDAGFQPHSLSAVGAFDVLEHVQEDRQFAETVHRLLRPSGRFYLTVPAFKLLWSSYDEHVGHYRRYTLASLSAVLRTAGFTIDRATYLYAPLPLPILLFRCLPSWLRMRRSRSFQQFEKEYAPRRGLLVRLAESVLKLERRYLARGARLRFGSSCLVVARKPGR